MKLKRDMAYSPSFGRDLLAIALLLFCATAPGDAHSPLVEAWEKGDESAIFSFGDEMDVRPYLALDDSDVAAIAELMARWIPIRAELESDPDQSWRQFKTEQDWTPFFNALPKTSEIKKRFGLGLAAAWDLRALAEKGRVSDASRSILPELIEGLDHPWLGETGRDSFYALASLTRMYNHLPHGLPVGHETELKAWYRAWWEANKSEHLIVDSALRQQMKDSLLAACGRIQAATTQGKSSLQGFRAPSPSALLVGGQEGALFETSYFQHSEVSGINLLISA